MKSYEMEESKDSSNVPKPQGTQAHEAFKYTWCAVAETPHGTIPGKVHTVFDPTNCYYPYYGKEHKSNKFRIIKS